MLVHPKKEIELKDVAYIMLDIDDYNGYYIRNLLFNRYNCLCYQLPITPTLREMLNDIVHHFVVGTLNHWSSILRIDDSMSDNELTDMMQRNFKNLFQHPNSDVMVIEERATHQLRIEMSEAARAFILNYYHRLSYQDQKDFWSQLTDDTILTVYFEPQNERFELSFADQPYTGDDEMHFACGHVVMEPEDIEEIFF